ncbi:hypothetical protein L6452_00900 [Arctium lappa]|uniref:Uncharacterized protein n=1 Tax=Arctium lappa TaxID=4217 RepID=A0ACB9FF53_ARCLA|nr:hypothetical protein L6452_00900 [Arctium lappa]
MRVILTSKFGPNANFSELEKFLQPNENWEDNIASLSMLFPNRIWNGDIDSLSTTILTVKYQGLKVVEICVKINCVQVTQQYLVQGVNPALSFTIHSCLVPTSRSTTHAFCEIAIPGHPFDTADDAACIALDCIVIADASPCHNPFSVAISLLCCLFAISIAKEEVDKFGTVILKS